MTRCQPQAPIDHDDSAALGIMVSAEANGRSDNSLDTAVACAAIELLSRVTEATTIDEAAAELVNRLKAFVEGEGAALGLTKSRHGRCRLAAISGVTETSAKSDLSIAIDQALMAVAQDEPADLACASSAATANLQALLPNAAIESYRLKTAAGEVVGSLLVWGTPQRIDTRIARTFLRVGSEPLAATLRLVQQAQAGILRRCLRRVFGTRRWITYTILAAVGLSAMAILPYRVEFDCVAEPLTHRFVAAPFAGVFEKSLVRPGDLVSETALLGRMDGRELRLELATVTADYERTRKSRDVNLAAGKVAAAQIDKLDLDRLDQQCKLLQGRLENVEIRSPVAGYVISGDLQHTEGAPLTLGQLLYEIAPLDQMIVEVAIDDDEVTQVSEGQSVEVRFDAYRGETFVGRLVRIHPRSEIRDARNVFIGEVELQDNRVPLRPGMSGAARIAVEDQSLLFGFVVRTQHWFAKRLGL